MLNGIAQHLLKGCNPNKIIHPFSRTWSIYWIIFPSFRRLQVAISIWFFQKLFFSKFSWCLAWSFKRDPFPPIRNLTKRHQRPNSRNLQKFIIKCKYLYVIFLASARTNFSLHSSTVRSDTKCFYDDNEIFQTRKLTGIFNRNFFVLFAFHFLWLQLVWIGNEVDEGGRSNLERCAIIIGNLKFLWQALYGKVFR